MPKKKFFAPFAVGIAVCLFSVSLSLLKNSSPPPVSIQIEGLETAHLQSVEISRKAPFMNSRVSMHGDLWRTERIAFSFLLAAPLRVLPEIEKIRIKVGEKEKVLEGSRIERMPGYKEAGSGFILSLSVGNFDYWKPLKPFAASFAVYVFMSVAGFLILRRRFSIFVSSICAAFFCAAGILSAEVAVLSAVFFSLGFFLIFLILTNLPSSPVSARPSRAEFEQFQQTSLCDLYTPFVFAPSGFWCKAASGAFHPRKK